MKITLDGERSISWNKFYSGLHWTERRNHVEMVRALILSQLDRTNGMFKEPVDITVTVYFKSHPQDPDNICTKLYIDGLVGHIIEDDSPRYVSSVMSRSRIDKERPRVEIEVRQS